MHSPCPRLYVTAAFAINTTSRFEPWSNHSAIDVSLIVTVSLVQSAVPVMTVSEADDESAGDIVLMTTGLSHPDRDDVSRYVSALGWMHVDDFTTQGTTL